jgi:large subunit ribosomal protein L10
MPTKKKGEAIAALTKQLKAAKVIVVTDYRGMPTPELNVLRARLRTADAQFVIAKNTLLQIAARNVGITGLDPALEGPTAVAISNEKDAEVAKAVADYVRTTKTVLAIKGGALGTEALTKAQVEDLALLPPKPALQALLAGTIQGPLSGFVGLLNGALSEICRVLDEREKQLAVAS